MNTHYTVSVNNHEYLTGLYETEKEAWEEVKRLLQSWYHVNSRELEDDLWEVADGYGYHVQDILLPEKETVTLTVVSSQSEWDDRTGQRLYIDGRPVLTVIDLTDCPEDAIIGRDLTSAEEVADYIVNFQKKHAGKEIILEHKEVEWEEF